METFKQRLIDYLPEGFKAPATKALKDAETKSTSLLTNTLTEAQKVFAKKNKLVKETHEIWKNQSIFFANSIKIDGSKGKGKKRPDDEVYQDNKDLQRYLPRGFTVVFLRETMSPIFLLSSFAKFFGKGKEDDDDCKMTTPITKEAESFIITTKANGEMCQVAGFEFASSDLSQWYWLIGSKNRKILVQKKEDIDQYREEQAYQFACPMADAWFKIFDHLTQDQKRELKDFLTATKLTINFEYEQTENQHVIPLTETKLVLIGLTTLDFPKGLHPAVTYAFSKFLNDCSCVINTLEEHSIENLDTVAHDIAANDWDTEGVVIYALNRKHEVVDMKKIKTWRYVWQRAVREKILFSLKARQVVTCRKQTERRLFELARDLQIPKNTIKHMIGLSIAFIDWCFLEADKPDDRFQTQYPGLWTEFLETHGLPDDQTLIQINEENIPKPKDVKSARVILTQGIPGLGKNYIFERLADYLEKNHNQKVKVITQDEFADHTNSGDICFQETMKHTYSGDYDIVILARNNSCKKQYERYIRNLDNYVLIYPEELSNQSPNDPKRQRLIRTCIASVLGRQANNTEKHPTDTLPPEELATLPIKFASVFRPDPLAFPFKFLKENHSSARADPKFGKIINFFQKRGFDTKLTKDQQMDFSQYLSSLDKNQHEERRPIDELLKEITEQLPTNIQFPIHGQFLGIQLAGESKQKLQPIFDDPSYNRPTTGTEVGDHVTLIHSNGFQANQQLWHELMQRQGETHRFLITRLKHTSNQLLCAEVDFQSHSQKTKKHQQLQVSSGFPHLTLKLWNNTQAVKSISVIKDEKIPWINLPNPIELEGTLRLLP